MGDAEHAEFRPVFTAVRRLQARTVRDENRSRCSSKSGALIEGDAAEPGVRHSDYRCRRFGPCIVNPEEHRRRQKNGEACSYRDHLRRPRCRRRYEAAGELVEGRGRSTAEDIDESHSDVTRLTRGDAATPRDPLITQPSRMTPTCDKHVTMSATSTQPPRGVAASGGNPLRLKPSITSSSGRGTGSAPYFIERRSGSRSSRNHQRDQRRRVPILIDQCDDLPATAPARSPSLSEAAA